MYILPLQINMMHCYFIWMSVCVAIFLIRLLLLNSFLIQVALSEFLVSVNHIAKYNVFHYLTALQKSTKYQMNTVTNSNLLLNASLVPGASFIYFETHTLNNDSKVIQTIDLSQFGLKLYFQPNTLLEPVTFEIGVIESQNFVTPPNTTLVSALYYINASSELLQPVIIEIEHCVNIDSVDNARLTFARADTDSPPPYTFEKLSNGRFGRTSFGTIKLSNFSEVAVFAENASSVNYLAQFFTSLRTGSPNIYRYRMNLVVSRELNAIKEVVIMMST